MEATGNTILITGGSTGMGLAFAESFLKLGNEVIICGRSEEKLEKAKRRFPQLHTFRCDISKDADRKALFALIDKDFKNLNILINNAGIQRPLDFKKGIFELLNKEDEIDINFKSPIYMSAYFIPIFAKQKEAAIINVSSGLAFIPLSMFPVYCATKAAIHSFSMSLRHQLKDTSIRVFEIIPPIVHDTLLKGKEIEKTDFSSSSFEIADALITAIKEDNYEIPVGAAKHIISNSKTNPEKGFNDMNH